MKRQPPTQHPTGSKILSAGLRLIGSGAIAAALLWDLVLGHTLHFGIKQAFLLLSGLLVLLASLPAVQQHLRGLLARSRAQTPLVQQRLHQRPRLFLLYGLWFGLVIGLAEVARHAFNRLLGKVLFMGIDLVWMIPSVYIVIFTCFGLLFFMLAHRWQERPFLQIAIFVYGLLGFTSLLLLVGGLHKLAVLVLATGLAVQLSRLAVKHTYLLHLLVRSTTLWLVLLVLGLAGGRIGWQHFSEQHAIAQLPAASPKAPNVLLLVLDTVRAKSLSLYGYDRPTTPQLEHFSERGLVFDRALSTSPWTLSAHGSMFTGRFPHELNADWTTPLSGAYPTLAEMLGEHGYLTAGFVANTIYCTREFGLDRGFIHYKDFLTSPGQAFLYTSLSKALTTSLDVPWSFRRKNAEHINQSFLDWLSTQEADRPFFAFLNYYDAHSSYQSPEEFALKFSPKVPMGDVWARGREGLETWSAQEIEEFIDAYDSSIAYLDHQLGLLFEELDRRDELQNTLVIVTSDHGEQFGEHGLLEHANSLYMPLLHVPLLMVYPSNLPAGRRIDAFVSLRDLPATVAELVGLDSSVRFPGASLSSYWNPAADSARPAEQVLLAEVNRAWAYPSSYPAMKGKMRTLISEGTQYIKNYGDGREELYNLVSDFSAEHDLSETRPLQVKQFQTYLEQMVPGTDERVLLTHTAEQH